MLQTRKAQVIVAIVTLIGAAIYIAKSIYFAHSALSIGDEGAYLFKGLAFARGEYRPFQEYGFWTNKAPLAFLIPGYIQYWFGAGLREARYFAIGVSVLMLAGLWITANRLGGKGWAALAIWVFALSDPHVATYSQALSQGLVACMMSWMFVCTLGEDRPLWQLILGSILSVLVVMVRQNMIVVPPLLVLFIFWQYGSKAGWWAFVASVTLFVAFHVVYWPQILQLWTPWLPVSSTPYLDRFRDYGTSIGTFSRAGPLSKWWSAATGMRDHFFVLCGSVCAGILWSRSDQWSKPRQFKTAVFLGLLFLALFLLHAWGSLGNNFCTLCFTSYQMFFSITGYLFVLVVFSNGLSDSKYRTPFLVTSLLFSSTLLGLYYFPWWSDWLMDFIRLPRAAPFLDEGRISFATLREVLTYSIQMSPEWQKRITAALGGLLAGVVLMIFLGLLHRRNNSISGRMKHSFNLSAAKLFLLTGVLLPSLLDLGNYQPKCSTNFLTYYEQSGKRLADIIPPGSHVYWKGNGRQLALLLYLRDIRYFPPQISAGAGALIGESDRLLKFGRYNEQLDAQWRDSADILLIWRFFPLIDFDEFQDTTRYKSVPFDMGGLRECEEPLYLYQRIP